VVAIGAVTFQQCMVSEGDETRPQSYILSISSFLFCLLQMITIGWDGLGLRITLFPACQIQRS